jgi:methionine synthase I (cobalamin-dependent)
MDVREYLKTRPLVFDGAMGTYYAGLNMDAKKCEMANLNDKSTILKIHQEYLNAGCKAIKTNTFGANKVSLERDFATVKEVIINGYEIGMEAVKGTDAFVFADIGPIPALEEKNLQADYLAIIDVFLGLGATDFLFETFGSAEHLRELAAYIKKKNSEAFILVEFAVTPEGFTRLGHAGKKLFTDMSQVKEIDAVGFNCISGPYHLLQYIKNFKLTDKPVAIMPNAGYPTVINNRTFFNNSAEYFAAHMLEFAKRGVKILGGCCGTTPKFIEQTVQALSSFKGREVFQGAVADIPEKNKDIPQNLLIDKITSGEKIIAVELDPPVDTEIDFFMESAAKLKNLGVEAITIADCPIARARVDSSLLACKLKRELDIMPIPHLTCRDRNINATKALLLGLSIEGINNVLVVTGDPIPTAERDEIKAMFSFNSVILANHITTLNETIFSSPFNILAALNVNARNFDNQLNNMQNEY